MGSKIKIYYAKALLLIMVFQIISPTIGYALSGGPSQPEFQSFEPIGTSEMVNLPSGDFTYNIPLLDISGYPINIAYHSGITADMEASTVGLGWNINPGVINRNVRALPDDFNGEADAVTKQFNMNPNFTAGAKGSLSLELFGLQKFKNSASLNLSLGVFYNSYWGMGCEYGLSPSISASKKGAGKLTASMGLNTNSQNGANFSPNLSYSKTIDEKNASAIAIGAGIGLQVNSRDGLKELSISSSISKSLDRSSKYLPDLDVSASSQASFSFATPSYMPQVGMDMTNSSYSINYSPVGFEMFGLNASTAFTGYVSKQKLKHHTKVNNAFGMLYAEKADGENALMDFNREKDGAFGEHTVSLPIVNPGNDIYSVSGQGVGGSYQLKRSDAGVFFDAKETSTSHGGDLGLELGAGNLYHLGVDVKMNYANSTSAKWTDDSDNDLLSSMDFRTSHPSANGLYEAAYFKSAGEIADETDMALYQKMGSDKAVSPILTCQSNISFKVKTKQEIKQNSGPNIQVGNYDLTRAKRERRQQSITYLTANEANSLHVQPIYSHRLNSFEQPSKVNLPRITSERKGHHISEITTNRPDGMRYIYGIPAYNLKQREVTFNTASRIVNCSNGSVKYVPGIDNSFNNNLGKDHFFNAVETKPFAHSYLLTAVLSADYQDITGDGITEDDLGSYTLFNYARVHENYQWRVPIGKNEANYSEGLLSDPSDDKGSYIYGTKEIWILHSVESKTMIAEFEYDDQNRKDGFGVKSENGEVNPDNKSLILKKITLYSKQDRMQNLNNAMPVKTVHFEYDYSLCPGTENSIAANKGKLTLKKLYFTYGYSKKSALSPYLFSYKNSDQRYDIKSYDRWGNFKRNQINTNCERPLPNHPITNTEFPYSEQDETVANQDAGTWCLNQIKLPSGGTIEVNYEAKHYAYVQDKNAMQMMQITGIGSIGGNALYNGSNNSQKLYFKVPTGTTPAQLKRDFLRNIETNTSYIYLKCFVKMDSTNMWEYLPVYAQMENYGVENNNMGWIQLKLVPKKDSGSDMINPISKMAFQFIRKNMPEVAYGQTVVTPASIEANPATALQPLVSATNQLGQLFTGFNDAMINRNYGREINLGRSFIRLYNPNGKKFGGGSLVSKIEIKDNWGGMVGEEGASFSYGQTYEYTDSLTLSDGKMRLISSGVASYEPSIGGDENPFHQAVVVNETRKWAIDNIHYTEEPFGESFMPAPEIVYSKIIIRNLQYAKVKQTATGHIEECYYTARDYPTKLERTDLQRMPRRINPIFSLLKVKMKEHMNAAQGFSVITNNMHGQLKSKKVYDENGTLISGLINHYQNDANKGLNNVVNFIHPDGSIKAGMLGVDFQLSGDARQSINKSIAGGVAFNIDIFQAGILPLLVAVPWPDLTMSENRFRSMSLTKVIHKIGILEKVEAFDLGSTISSKNLAYDPETGACLLTETQNEFEDPIFSLKMPAHWAYEGMQGAYKNTGYVKQISNAGNAWQITNIDANIFFPGDELAFYQNNTVQRVWVLELNKITNKLTLINRCGAIIGPNNLGNAIVKIMRSGRRNMPSTEIGTIVSLKNPIAGNPKKLVLNSTSEIISSKAFEYSDQWQGYCDKRAICSGKDLPNPYVNNILGVWRGLKSWVYLSDRKSLASNTSQTNIRKDGAYTNFNSFWLNQPNLVNVPYTSRICNKNTANWTWTNQVTKFDPNGVELENRDRLGRFSAELIGYHHLLVTGVASNSRHQQIAFDGFEDYRIVDNQRHFGEQSLWSSGKITTETYHTGKYALKLGASQSQVFNYSLTDNCPVPPLEEASESAVPNRANTPTSKSNKCECIKPFLPSPGKYVVIVWVKQGTGLGFTNYTTPKITIQTNSSSTDFLSSGAIIEGWQRIYGEFSIANADQALSIKLVNGGALTTYFDDIKIFPFAGNMKNYIFDDISLKLNAELDENGYASIYEYNAEGQLIRVKKETEIGIVTLKESRSAMPKFTKQNQSDEK